MTSVAEILISGLKAAGTPRIFGVPGDGSHAELLESAQAQGLPFIPVRQETAASIMAAVTGDLTGKPGAALGVNGLVVARPDRAPMTLLTGRHPDDRAPAAEWTFIVTPESAAEWVATSLVPAPLPPPDRVALDAAADLMRDADRPVLLVGLQCRTSEDAKWLRALAESMPAPVLTTSKAKGAVPDPHPLCLGVLGGEGNEEVIRTADLIVALGLDPVELPPHHWEYSAPVVHLGRSPHSGGPYTSAVEVVGEISAILEELAPRLRQQTKSNWDVALVDRVKRSMGKRFAAATTGLAPSRVVQIAREFTPAGTIASVDPGDHVSVVTAFWQAVEPGEFLISHDRASIGFALPAAIAAQLVHSDRRVLCFTGASGLLSAAAELETVVSLKLPVVVIVFNGRAGSAGPDLAALARGFGLSAFTVGTDAEFHSAFLRAVSGSGPTLVDARIDPSGDETGGRGGGSGV